MADAPDRDVLLTVINDVALGSSIRQACNDHGVHFQQFYRAIQADSALCERYAQAKELGLEAYADSIEALAAEEPPDVATQFSSHKDAAWVQWQRNRIDTRKWLLSKLAPKKYGDRTILAGDADNPLSVDVADAKAALAGRLGQKPIAGSANGMAGKPK